MHLNWVKKVECRPMKARIPVVRPIPPTPSVELGEPTTHKPLERGRGAQVTGPPRIKKA